ncbi:amidohydrolase family protein [bacterium]|nr:amidohydrolase family protein [bacterium]
MIFDAHVHIGRNMMFHIDIDADQLVAVADRAGIDKMMVTEFSALMYDSFLGNEIMRKFHRQHPDRIFPYFTVSTPRVGKRIIDEFERYVNDYGFVGLKIYSTPPTHLMIDSYMYPLIEKAAEFRVPILAHSNSDECEIVSKRIPEAMLINAHMNGSPQGHGDWQRAIAAAKACPNIILDTTTSSFDNAMIETAVEELGPERIVYGSDCPLLDPVLQIAKVRGAEISDEAKALILGGNMERLLSLRR